MNKKMLLGLGITTLLVSSCGLGTNNSISTQNVKGEYANFVVASDFSDLKLIYDAVLTGMQKGMDKMTKDLTESDMEGADAYFAAMENIPKIYNEFGMFDASMIAAFRFDIENLDMDSIQDNLFEKENFSTDAVLSLENNNSFTLVEGIVAGMLKAKDLSDEELEKQAREFQDTFSDEDEKLFKEGKIKELVKKLLASSEGMGVSIYSEMTKYSDEEEETFIDKQIQNIKVKDKKIAYTYNEENKLGGNLSKNKTYKNYQKHIGTEIPGYSFYFDYTDILQKIKEEAEKNGQEFTADAIIENFPTSQAEFGKFDFEKDGKAALELLLQGDVIAFTFDKKETVYTVRVDLHTQAEKEALGLITDYKTLLSGSVQTIFGMYGVMGSRYADLTEEESKYITSMLETGKLDMDYSDDFLSISINLDTLNDEKFASLLEKIYENLFGEMNRSYMGKVESFDPIIENEMEVIDLPESAFENMEIK